MIVDANILLYAVNPASRFHRNARSWLDSALNGTMRVGLPWSSLLAFQRVSTNARAWERPLAAEFAWALIADWLAAPSAWVPVPGDRHADILGRLIIDGDVRGDLVMDAHLAALAIEHGVGICSADSDFARFPEVRWFNPTA